MPWLVFFFKLLEVFQIAIFTKNSLVGWNIEDANGNSHRQYNYKETYLSKVSENDTKQYK